MRKSELAPQTEKKGKESRKNVLRTLSTGAAALLLVGCGPQGTSNESNPTSERSPASSAPATAGETETAEQPIEYGISAAEFENDPEALIREYYAQHNAFLIAGATKEAEQSDDRYTLDTDEFITQLSTPINEEFIGELFVDDWIENPNLAEYVISFVEVAEYTRKLRIFSLSNAAQDSGLEPYTREMIINSVEVSSEPSITTSVKVTDHDNRFATNVADHLEGEPNDATGGGTYTWVNIDGKMKIADISFDAQ
ncbi:MAG: hypothetical protein WBK76_03055 [Candidatus Saccharimonadales bacterium]